MSFFQTFAMAVKNIFLNKTRSMLTMLGIIIGVASVIALVTVMDGKQEESRKMYTSMGVNRIDIYYNSWQGTDLTSELYEYCSSLTEYITGVTPNETMQAAIRYRTKNMNSRCSYGSDDYDDCNNLTVAKGRPLSYSDIKNRTRVCVLGSYVADRFFGLEDPVGKTIKIQGYNFTVIGVYKEKFGGEEYSQDNSILVPYTIKRTFNSSSTFSQYTAKAKDAASTSLAIDKIKEFLKPHFKNEWDYNVYSDNEWISQIGKEEQTATLMVVGIASISLLVGGIGIMNIMLVSVSERTREIGIRMAIGAKESDIIWQFLIESAVVSALGGIIGIALGSLISVVASAAIIKTVYLPSAAIILISFGFSALLGMFFGFYPARKAAKMPPVEALRNN